MLGGAMRIAVAPKLTRLDAWAMTASLGAPPQEPRVDRAPPPRRGLAVHDPPLRGYTQWQRLEIVRCRLS